MVTGASTADLTIVLIDAVKGVQPQSRRHAAVASLLGIPHLVELNAPLPWEAARYRSLEAPERARELEAEVLERADTVFAVSGPLRDYALARGARRVELLPNAADPERFALRRREPKAPVAVFMGSLRPWHGLDTIAEAWERLGSGAPRLVVIGDGRRADVRLPASTELLGAVPYEHVPRVLARATIGLAPYGKDSPGYFSPLKLFEYLAAGLAVVAGAIPGVVEAVGPEQAVLTPPGDPVALADAVAALAANRDRCRLLGAKGRALVEERHTWRHRASRVIAVARSPVPEAALR
jgi:glycosyltransferase involved in cell wall biosynthesis